MFDFSNIAAFIDVVKNPELFEKQMKTMKDQYDQVVGVIELIAPAKDIEKLHTEAGRLLEKATKEAKDLLEKVDAENKTRTVESEAILKSAEAVLKAKEDELKEVQNLKKEIQSLNAEAKKQKAKLEQDVAEFKEKEALLLKTQSDVSERLEKLKQVMG